MVEVVRNREAMREARAHPGEEWGRQAGHTAELGTGTARQGREDTGAGHISWEISSLSQPRDQTLSR